MTFSVKHASVWQGLDSEKTIPISAVSSQPAILQTSVDQNPQVSFLLYYQHTKMLWAKTFILTLYLPFMR